MASKHHFQLSPGRKQHQSRGLLRPPKKPDTRVSPQQTKETLRPRLDVNDVLLDYSGELGVMMRWCGSSERERHKDVPRSVPPTCSVGHVGGEANVCVWVYA